MAHAASWESISGRRFDTTHFHTVVSVFSRTAQSRGVRVESEARRQDRYDGIVRATPDGYRDEALPLCLISL